MKRLMIAVLGLAASVQAAKLPRSLEPNLYFEPNRGQAPSRVQFLSQGMGGMAALMDREAILRIGDSTVRMRLAGARASTGEALEPQPGVSSYFTTRDASGWHSGVPHYSRVRFRGVYPGIDLVYYGSGGRLEYDFVVSPGADPNQIRLRYEGLRSVSVNSQGDLLLSANGGEIRQRRPRVYQEVDGVRREIAASYQIVNEQEVRFSVAAFAKDRTLVIDPVLEYGTYFGSVNDDQILSMAVGADGNVYLAGSFGLPGETSNPYRWFDALPVTGTATLMKFSPATNTVLYMVHLGGGVFDKASAVAVDADGAAYLAGSTQSTKLPLVNAFQSTPHIQFGGSTGFVSKISADGRTLLYSTYLGGSAGDAPVSIAVDSTGAAYVGGGTNSKDFPLVNPVQSAFGKPVTVAPGLTLESQMIFLSKLSPDGGSLLYSTFYGGTGWNQLVRVVLDAEGSPYLTGFTTATDFPLVNPIQSSLASLAPRFNQAAFAVKLTTDGQSVAYSTYLGGNSLTGVSSAAVDAVGNLYLAGNTLASDFPVVNALQSTLNGVNDGFLSKLNARGSALLYSTYLGGSGADQIDDIVVDAAGNLYGAGSSTSADFPLAGPPIADTRFGDAIVFKLSPSGGSMIWAMPLGGARRDSARSIAVNPSGSIWVAGRTESNDFPTTPDALQSTKSGLADVFLAKLSAPAPVLTVVPAALEFTILSGEGAVPQQVSVSYTDGPPCGQCLVEAVTLDGGAWLSGKSAAVEAPGQLSIAVDTSSLTAGSYTGTVRLTPPDGRDSGELIVTLKVY